MDLGCRQAGASEEDGRQGLKLLRLGGCEGAEERWAGGAHRSARLSWQLLTARSGWSRRGKGLDPEEEVPAFRFPWMSLSLSALKVLIVRSSGILGQWPGARTFSLVSAEWMYTATCKEERGGKTSLIFSQEKQRNIPFHDS